MPKLPTLSLETMTIRVCVASLLLAAVIGCQSSPAELPPETVIRTGTAFGFCAGYCSTELEIRSTHARFTRSGRDPQRNPPQVTQVELTSAEVARIRSLAASVAFADLKDVYGCPDCADGGAEWVELDTGALRKRVTFDHGAGPPELQPVLQELRALREKIQPR
jgi:hypothetical protein